MLLLSLQRINDIQSFIIIVFQGTEVRHLTHAIDDELLDLILVVLDPLMNCFEQLRNPGSHVPEFVLGQLSESAVLLGHYLGSAFAAIHQGDLSEVLPRAQHGVLVYFFGGIRLVETVLALLANDDHAFTLGDEVHGLTFLELLNDHRVRLAELGAHV